MGTGGVPDVMRCHVLSPPPGERGGAEAGGPLRATTPKPVRATATGRPRAHEAGNDGR
ncbi:MAG: hypothetical protein JWO90_1752 [Solirubrobacterales bacterium]|jgi:hypothetical protein|nr:hypothetical protein [Solirubrobacterales bacterium]